MNAESIRDVDSELGFADESLLDEQLRRLPKLRPFSFFARRQPDGQYMLYINVLDAHGKYRRLSAHHLPAALPLRQEYVPDLSFPVLQTRCLSTEVDPVTNLRCKEPFVRLLGANALRIDDMPPAHIVYGEHPDFPGKKALYMGVARIGVMPLSGSKPNLYPPEDRTVEYYDFNTEPVW